MGEEPVVQDEESVTLALPRSQPPAATWNGLGSWNVIHAAPPPSWAPLLLPSPAGWPVGHLLTRGLEEEEEEEL